MYLIILDPSKVGCFQPYLDRLNRDRTKQGALHNRGGYNVVDNGWSGVDTETTRDTKDKPHHAAAHDS